jgi:hypothetical protein
MRAQVLAAMLLSILLSFNAQARDTVIQIPLADVLAMPEAQSSLDGSVKFFLAGQNHPKVIETKGSDVSNKKTNAFNKSDEFACRWTILSALIAFQDSARKQEANAVIDIVSYYRSEESRNASTIECHAGALMAGAALKGTYAKIAK